MGNPIQYHNTDNPSQMGGGYHNSWEGLLQQSIVVKTPPGVFPNGKAIVVCPPWGIPKWGVNENFTPAILFKVRL